MLKYWCHGHDLWRTRRMLEKDNGGKWVSIAVWELMVSLWQSIKNKGTDRQCWRAGQTTQKGFHKLGSYQHFFITPENPQEHKSKECNKEQTVPAQKCKVNNRTYSRLKTSDATGTCDRTQGKFPTPNLQLKKTHTVHKDRTSPKTLKPQNETPNQLMYHTVWDLVVLVFFPCPEALRGALSQLENSWGSSKANTSLLERESSASDRHHWAPCPSLCLKSNLEQTAPDTWWGAIRNIFSSGPENPSWPQYFPEQWK